MNIMLRLLEECTDYDFKQEMEVRKPKSWLKSVSAFANGVGGSLFFGITDENTVRGVENPKEMIAAISDLIKTRIDPTPIFRLIPHEIDSVIVLELQVSKGQFTPYYYSADGNKIAFVRSGDQSIPAPSYILNELILKGLGQTYDAILTNERKDDYSFTYLTSKYLSMAGVRFEREDYESFGLADGDLLTRGGLLLADSNKLRQCRVFCTRWNGTDKVSEETVLADLEVSGSLLIQLDRAMAFFEDNTKRSWRKQNGDTVYESEYDYEAVKEALVNAIVHRDYNIVGAEVVLNIYNDRIEITSPGGMYSGKKVPDTVESVMESKRRNPVIADLFHRMHLMNRRGSGLANISNRTNALFGGGRHVRFRSDDEFFVVTIENARFSAKGTVVGGETAHSRKDIEELILTEMRGNPRVSVTQIGERVGLSRSTVLRAIKTMTERGELRRIGSPRNGQWEIL